MTPLVASVLVLLAAILTLASYICRVYADFGKILPRDEQENLDAWEELIEPRLGLSRDHAALSASILQQLSLGIIALEFGAVLFDRLPDIARPSMPEIAQAVLAVVLVIVFCNHVVPTILFNRTRGRWVRRLLWPIGFVFWLISPVTIIVRFFFSLAALAEQPATPEEEAGADVEDLIEAGEEEGILEESDKDLVRSAIEFGDKLVREVMTPRPEIFAVPDSLTIEQFLDLLREHTFSRVPVYSGTLDNVSGIAFAHDLLQIADADARARTVATIQRPAAFVPETKRVYELLREMQREKQHMSIVIDEHGGVAGIATIEDLLEEIVGEIHDEHETDISAEEPQHEPGGSWLVPGTYPVDQLPELFGQSFEIGGRYEATTLGGLVTEVEGRIPIAGEIVILPQASIRVEVLVSTDRRIERLRIFPPAIAPAES